MSSELSGSAVHLGGAATGPRLFIHRRVDGRAGQRLGEARLLFPQIVQVLPPLDVSFGTTAVRARDLLLSYHDPAPRTVRIAALRPALLTFDQAAQLAEHNGSGGLFAATSSWMVALELSEPLPGPTRRDAPDTAPKPVPGAPPDARPWWCKVFCLTGCGTC